MNDYLIFVLRQQRRRHKHSHFKFTMSYKIEADMMVDSTGLKQAVQHSNGAAPGEVKINE